MREIKFRGKKKNGTWLFGDLVQRPPIALIFPLDAPDSPDNYIVDLKTVGQFTGLTDKNGVEIYEGDICEVEYYTNVTTKENSYLNQVVELSCCDYVLKAKEKPVSECSLLEIYCHINLLSIIHRNDFNRIKVIGNIYENHELL